MDEFEEMRRELTAMKLKLNTQQIINKELIRKVMRNQASWMNRLVNAELISLPIIFLLLVAICYICNITQWFAGIFMVLGCIDAMMDLWTIRIPGHLFGSSSIIDLKKRLLRQKKYRFFQTIFMGVASLVWLYLFLKAVSTSENSGFYEWSLDGFNSFLYIAIGICVIVIGVLYWKMQRTNDKILNQITEFEKDD